MTGAPEIPADVRSELPEAALGHFSKVFTASINSGETADSAKTIALKGLKNAGWYKDAAGWMSAKRAPVAKRADGGVTFRVPVAKVESTADSAIVSGWAYVSLDEYGNAIVDHDNETIPVPVLERAAARFLAKSREFNATAHYSETCGQLIQSVVFTPASRVAMGLDGSGLTGWWVSAKVFGSAAKDAREGLLKEFSIEATALKRKTPAGPVVFDDLDVSRITLVDQGAGIHVRIEAVKALAPTVEEAISSLSDQHKQVVMSAIQTAATPPQKEAAVADPVAPVPPAVAPKAGDPADLASALAMIAELQKQIAAMKPAEGEDAIAKARKDLPEAVRKQLEDMESAAKSEREASAKKIADLEAQNRARDLADSRKEFVAKAAKLKFSGVNATDLGEGMRVISGMVAKDATTKAALDAVLKALDVYEGIAAKSALFQDQGGNRPVTDGDSPEAQLEQKAVEICKRDDDLKHEPVHKALKTARVRAYAEHPDLYAQIRKN